MQLIKDCCCCTHEGPHWLHMDAIRHSLNRQLLDQGNAQGFLHAEIQRLKDKESAMVWFGIEEIV